MDLEYILKTIPVYVNIIRNKDPMLKHLVAHFNTSRSNIFKDTIGMAYFVGLILYCFYIILHYKIRQVNSLYINR